MICRATIPAWALPALVNNNWEGLSKNEKRLLKNFIRKNNIPVDFISYSEVYFDKNNDVTDLGGDVIDIEWTMPATIEIMVGGAQ